MIQSQRRILEEDGQPAPPLPSRLECPPHMGAENARQGCWLDGLFVSLLDVYSGTYFGVVKGIIEKENTHHIWTLLADMSSIFAKAIRSSVEGNAVLA